MTTLTQIPSVAADPLGIMAERRIAPFRVYAYVGDHRRVQVAEATILRVAEQRAADLLLTPSPKMRGLEVVKVAIVDQNGMTRVTVDVGKVAA